MKKDIIIVDDFYENPIEVRQYALKELREKAYRPYNDEPSSWFATPFKESKDCPFKSSKELISKLEFLIGETIDLEHWNSTFDPYFNGEVSSKSTRWNCCFHFKPICPTEKPGNRVHTHCVNPKNSWNNVGYKNWAGLIYLNPLQPLNAGLMNFTHIHGKEMNNKEYMFTDVPINPESRWKWVDSFGAVFNRLILERSDIPHQGANGFSNDLEEGRLFQTFFFKTINKLEEKAVEIKCF